MGSRATFLPAVREQVVHVLFAAVDVKHGANPYTGSAVQKVMIAVSLPHRPAKLCKHSACRVRSFPSSRIIAGPGHTSNYPERILYAHMQALH